jgi:hypothetical protein
VTQLVTMASLGLLVVLVFVVSVITCLFRSLKASADKIAATAAQGQLEIVGLRQEIDKARTAFAPTITIPCRHCNGTGRRTEENPLFAVLSKSVEAGLQAFNQDQARGKKK